MYVNQLSQNDHLVQDVKNLQSQIEVIRNQPARLAKSDTVYLLRTAPDGQSLRATSLAHTDYHINTDLQPVTNDDFTNVGTLGANKVPAEKPTQTFASGAQQAISTQHSNDEIAAIQNGAADDLTVGNAYSGQTPTLSAVPTGSKTFNNGFQIASINTGAEMGNGLSLRRKMSYELANKLSGRQVQRALLASNIQAAKMPISGKKSEQVAQAESVIPKLPLKTPYRFGAGYMVEGNGQGKTVLGEVIVKKKFSISAGITWLKIKPAEFFTETIFREKNRRDFKTTHPGEVPLIFDLYNIKIDQSVVQMPLTLAFRNTVKDDWAYYASMGTNIKLSSKETISYDCRGPKNEFFNQTFTKKGDVSPVTSMNFAVGIEKTWHPIVVQAEGYWVNYFNPITPLRHSSGPGLKVKLLYQIGRQM
jgi:hypothetical protein